MIDNTVTGTPSNGERYMTTGDMRELLAQAELLGDDGTAVLCAQTTSVRGKMRKAWVVVELGLLTPEQDWDRLRFLPATDEPPEIGHDPMALLPAGDDLAALPPPEGPGYTMEIPAAAAIPPARRQRRGGMHAKP